MNSLRHQARKVLESNWTEGEIQLLAYGYTRPSQKGPFLYKNGYQQQWLWDSCFHTYMNAKYFDVERAKRELSSLVYPTTDKRLVGAVTLWSLPKLTGFADRYVKRFFLRTKELSAEFTQPPFFATALRAIYERDQDEFFVSSMLNFLGPHYDYLYEQRVSRKGELPKLIHPLESGTDARVDFFVPFRIKYFSKSLGPLKFALKELLLAVQYILYGRHDYRLLGIKETHLSKFFELILARFDFVDPLFNTVYIENLRDLAWLYEKTGDKNSAKKYEKRANQAQRKFMKQLWHEEDGFFYGRYGTKNKVARVKTIGGLVPLYLTDLPKDKAERLVKHLLTPEEFWTAYPVPSCAVNEKAFNPLRSITAQLWRGPTWINTNWMIIKGLEKHGFADEAEELTKRTKELVKKSGFREYYNPLTGEGYGAEDFGWSTLAADL